MSASDVRLVWRPLDRWPRDQTSNRERSPFRTKGENWSRPEIGWTDTQHDLERELRQIGVREAVVQLAIIEADIRIDGQVRANARLSHPGVVLTFTHPRQGPLTFACDKWTTWQANIRGIAKALEALRLVDRYGITSTGEQYVGWKELPSGVPMAERAEEHLSPHDAARIIVGAISGAHDLEQNAREALDDEDYRRWAYRQALKKVHPDHGGTQEAFLRLERAKTVLDEAVNTS